MPPSTLRFLDSAIWLDLRPQDWGLLVQTLVWSARIVVSEVLVQDAAQVSFIDNQQLVKTFPSERTHPTFSKGIGIRRAYRCVDDVDAFRGENGVEDISVLAVAIMNQTAKGHFLLLELPNVLSGLLSNPRAVWMIGHTSQVNTDAYRSR